MRLLWFAIALSLSLSRVRLTTSGYSGSRISGSGWISVSWIAFGEHGSFDCAVTRDFHSTCGDDHFFFCRQTTYPTHFILVFFILVFLLSLLWPRWVVLHVQTHDISDWSFGNAAFWWTDTLFSIGMLCSSLSVCPWTMEKNANTELSRKMGRTTRCLLRLN